MTQKKKTLIAIVCLLIIAGGFGTLKLLESSRKAPKKVERSYLGPLVEILPAMAEDKEIIIHATGTVGPAEEITVIPQVSGLVTTVHPNLKSGGFIKKGEILFSLEDADYRAALTHAQAGVAKAQFELSMMRSRAEVARQEWERLKTDKEESPDPLLLFIPQIKNAEAGLASAKATVATAELKIHRTRISAPFDAIVRHENIDPGQFVSPGMAVASLASTEQVEIETPLRLEDIPYLHLPNPNGSGEGSAVRVETGSGTTLAQWEGKVTRFLGEVNPKTRMAAAIVTVDDPYGLNNAEQEQRPLSLGLFVDIYLKGKTLPRVVTIPRTAIRDNSTVWVMDENNKLRIKDVEVIRFSRNHALIGKGLTPGEKIVLTTLSGVADGMTIRTAQGEKSK